MTGTKPFGNLRKLATLGAFLVLVACAMTTGCSAHAGADVGTPGYVYVGE
jgi:hypothetical protein